MMKNELRPETEKRMTNADKVSHALFSLLKSRSVLIGQYSEQKYKNL